MKTKTEIKDILAGEGLGKIKFGISRDELKAIIGEPDEIERADSPESEDGGLIEIWHYDELELSVSFDEEENWRLINIAVSSSDYEFMGQQIIGLENEKAIAKLKELGLENLTYEDFVPYNGTTDLKVLSSEELNMNFWLENGALTEIQWEPLFIDDDMYDDE